MERAGGEECKGHKESALPQKDYAATGARGTKRARRRSVRVGEKERKEQKDLGLAEEDNTV